MSEKFSSGTKNSEQTNKSEYVFSSVQYLRIMNHIVLNETRVLYR